MDPRLFAVCFLLATLSYSRCYVSENTSVYYDCPKNLRTLEKALYETEENHINLIKTFYPSGKPSPALVQVIFTFVDESDCTLTYYWASGWFLLVEPPSVFRFASLFFSNEDYDKNDLKIYLPTECRPLAGEECTCYSANGNVLDILTQQVCKKNMKSICK